MPIDTELEQLLADAAKARDADAFDIAMQCVAQARERVEARDNPHPEVLMALDRVYRVYERLHGQMQENRRLRAKIDELTGRIVSGNNEGKPN